MTRVGCHHRQEPNCHKHHQNKEPSKPEAKHHFQEVPRQLLACLTSGATGSCFISASDGRWSPSCSAGRSVLLHLLCPGTVHAHNIRGVGNRRQALHFKHLLQCTP